MKKLLALTLALVLACSLCVPALAAETDETAPMVETDETDPVAEYIAAHPEEMAALDADALIAGWGYLEPRAKFMDDWGGAEDTFEEAVARHYADNRVYVRNVMDLLEEYKTAHPEDWAAFDAYRYFAGEVQSDYPEEDESVESYMAYHNLLSEDEFIAVMFMECIATYDRYNPADWEYSWDDPDAQPTLTLVVNGVASDVAITAGEGVTYADAAELRGILGVEAVAPTYEGPVPVREAAENAGWEVQWYDGGWEGIDQQVCLWNEDAFLTEVKPRMEGFQTLWDAYMDMARTALFTETPKRTVENATVTFKRFNTLDGDETYNLKLRLETVCEKGVLDCTVTFDVGQLLRMFTDSELAEMAADADLSVGDFKALFSAGKMELIVDYNSGGIACNIPLLGLLDEELVGWQTTYLPSFGETLAAQPDGLEPARQLYKDMVSSAEWLGGVDSREMTDTTLEAIGVFAGPDSVKTTGTTVTYTLETDKVNAALSKLIGYGDKTFSFFKKCDVTMTVTAQGKMDMTLAYRVDPKGFSEAMMADGEDFDLGMLVDAFDMELTAAAHGDLNKSTETLKLHIKNFGVFDVNTQSATSSADRAPRQIAEVERKWVEPADGATVTAAR